MDVSGIFKYASERGLALDGFDVHEMFPGKTNWAELMDAPNAASPTWLLLKLQIRRFALSIVHKAMESYAQMPHLRHSPIGNWTRNLLGFEASPMHYQERPCSVDELIKLENGPSCVAVALKFDPPSSPLIQDPPTTKKLADGTSYTPGQDDLDNHRRESDHLKEIYALKYRQALDQLWAETSVVTEWAVLTPCIKTLIIFEHSGQYAEHPREVFEFVKNKQATIAPSLQRDLICGFPGTVEGGDIQVIWADSNQICQIQADLFIAFDSCTNGYPLSGLMDAEVFVPTRRQLLASHQQIQLLDFIQAIKFYTHKSTHST